MTILVRNRKNKRTFVKVDRKVRMEGHLDRLQSRDSWMDHDRFGLFVHFGIYSVAARHEWVMTREKIATEEYARYAQFFDPDLFDAAEIAREAKRAGMQYAVLTAKHHDGFCLFDTALTDFNSVTYCGRDLVAEWVEALREEGIKVGLYYSQIDWRHPDYTIDYHHPRRDDADATEQNVARNWETYKAYLHDQVRELLTNYGEVDYLFFDFTYPDTVDGWAGKSAEDWSAEQLIAMCRELQPGIMINDRLGLPADLVTPEQYQPTEPMTLEGVPVRWEACQTLNGSWGYDRDNYDFKSIEMIVGMLVDTVSKGGNLLLNIGPDGRGAIPQRDRETLHRVGEWMRLHRDAVIGAGASRIPAPPNTVVTQRGNRAYISVLAWPFGHIHLPGMAEHVRFARLLNDGSEIRMEVSDPDTKAFATRPGGQPAGTLTLVLPVAAPDVEVPVIELFLDENFAKTSAL